ncbi:pyridine nucleotide-disulfide oxidoreductase [Alsobacter soli]|uniref:Pyridine nucleotide-disulfide oxidoreductase n=1 Tax=Alsobacter soli TaxID=2109933 RepID=A0A2T1HYM1_9HYPH|nr:FAD-dependent oxidoreductase [Alsobacter soli]PSC06715.1 pyridine nucleotide-disulfide oxidoreductase [Alsobacter soli]
MSPPIVIIGAGQSAAQAIASLRQLGEATPILIFGDEPHAPYQRPPLSKAFLAGETTADRLELKARDFYEEQGADLRLGQPVGAIRLRDREVETSDGRLWPYSRLLIATGMRPRPLPLRGTNLAGVHHVRAIRDVEAFRAELRPGARLVVIGAGYIGLEAAAKARALGLDVVVLEAAPRVLSRVVSPVVSAFFEARHARAGVRILTEARVEAIEGADRATGVTLVDGSTLPADIVLVAVGGVPNVELAAEAGLDVADGVVVDAFARTAAPDVYAAGDVANFPSRLYGRRVRLESVQNAIDQAKAAAAAMAGAPVLYDPVPWFWSDQFDVKLQIAGLSEGHDSSLVQGEPDSGSFSVEYRRAGRLLAVDSINAPRSHMLARRAIPIDLAGTSEAAQA